MAKLSDGVKYGFRELLQKNNKMGVAATLIGVMGIIDAYTPEPKRTDALKTGNRLLAILLRM